MMIARTLSEVALAAALTLVVGEVVLACGGDYQGPDNYHGQDATPDAHADAAHPCRPHVDHMTDGGMWCATALDAGIEPVTAPDGCVACYLVQCHADGTAPTFAQVECTP